VGNYVGYLNFDGVRYWDFRNKQVHTPVQQVTDYLPSDSRHRTDSIFLQTKSMEEAQTEKERLENIQRDDRTLRKNCKTRREKGGAKQ